MSLSQIKDQNPSIQHGSSLCDWFSLCSKHLKVFCRCCTRVTFLLPGVRHGELSSMKVTQSCVLSSWTITFETEPGSTGLIWKHNVVFQGFLQQLRQIAGRMSSGPRGAGLGVKLLIGAGALAYGVKEATYTGILNEKKWGKEMRPEQSIHQSI